MISGDFTHCEHLAQFYVEICALHARAHGDSYIDVHDEIIERLDNPDWTYKEFGINQGATLALALLARQRSVRGYDIKLSNFEPQRVLFENFATTSKINFRAEERSSLDAATLSDVDVLYIDTLHTGEHLRKELGYHAETVNKYIICHDTFAKPDMHKAIESFCLVNPDWRIAKYHQVNVGYTTLERIA